MYIALVRSVIDSVNNINKHIVSFGCQIQTIKNSKLVYMYDLSVGTKKPFNNDYMRTIYKPSAGS
jgi:hypothetical protein